MPSQYSHNLNRLESSIFYSRRVDLGKVAVILGALAGVVQAKNSETDKRTRDERDEALESNKELQEEIARMKQESYEESIKKHDAYTKIGSQEAEIEELKEEIDRLKSSSSKTSESGNIESSDTSSDSSGSGN